MACRGTFPVSHGRVAVLCMIALLGCSGSGNGTVGGDTLLVASNSLAPATAPRDSDVAMLILGMTASGPQDNAVTWTAVRVKRAGQGGNGSVDNVIVALDDGDGAWSGLAVDAPIGSSTTWEVDNTALVQVIPQTVTGGTPKTYFVVFHLGYGAPAGDNIAASVTGSGIVTTSGGSDGVRATAAVSSLTKVTLPVPPPGTFIRTGDMGLARGYHTATRLDNGWVLIAGGRDDAGTETAGAELYDHDRGVFLPAAGDMSTGRKFHTATLLVDGTVLIAGGNDGTLASGGTTDRADRFDPSTSTFRPTGSMTTRRQDHTETLLPGGMVLLAGGNNLGGPLDSAELYDPSTDTFAATATMGVRRKFHTATLLPGGKVLVAGGDNGTFLSGAYLFDRATGTFSPAGSMGTARSSHTATLLGDGTVLVTGGKGTGAATLASAEIYDPATDTFSPTVAPMTEGRAFHAAALLSDGKVLISGGYRGGDLATAEVYDPASRTFTATGNLVSKRDYHTATPLFDGTVLVTGGFLRGVSVPSAELFHP